mgnify:CR=1 FL=1
MKLDGNYWEDRYVNNNTGWDMGKVSPPLKIWLDNQSNKELKILIPGAGNAYEVEYAFANGFQNVFLLDIAPTAVTNFKNRNPNFPEANILLADFFNLEMEFDIIMEQTFFCALDPKIRSRYVSKCHEILKPDGKIVGLQFDFPLTREGPPFGGSVKEYEELYSPLFAIHKMERCLDSIEPRQGKELWVELQVK